MAERGVQPTSASRVAFGGTVGVKDIGKGRVLAAFLLAPWVVPMVFVICGMSGGNSAYGYARVSWWTGLGYGFLFYGSVTIPIAYLAEVVLGVPVWLMLRHRNMFSWPAFAGAGALLGWLVFAALVFFGWDAGKNSMAEFVAVSNPYWLLCILAGAASALAFRTVLFWRRR